MNRLLIFAFSIFSFQLFAQGIIKGLVYDNISNEPLPFASVQVEGDKYCCTN
jgi:hypothetical protein